jgi:uncharacterized membrane protein (UPF0127 family)
MKVWAWLLAGLVSCGHRVAEPGAKPDTTASVSSAMPASASSVTAPRPSIAASASSAAPTSAKEVARCLVPTPAEPVRPAPPQGPDPRCPKDPTGPFPLRRATVRVAGLDATVDVEVAERDEHRTRGLMFRKDLGENQGMLFVFDAEQELAFWMRNTCLPLDMLFVATDGTIVGIEENVPTLNDGHYAPGTCEARYVLEANAGWSRRHGVKAGQKLVLGGI